LGGVRQRWVVVFFLPSSPAAVFVVSAANWVAKRKARRRLRYNTATTT
jgi:hypothetical protein